MPRSSAARVAATSPTGTHASATTVLLLNDVLNLFIVAKMAFSLRAENILSIVQHFLVACIPRDKDDLFSKKIDDLSSARRTH